MTISAHEKIHAARISIISNLLLVLLKAAVGLLVGSVAVLSEAVHSATDLLAALIAFFAVRASDIPPDDDHPYGHGKVESVSGLVEALLIFAAAVAIIVQATLNIVHHVHETPGVWGIAVMFISAVVNIFVARNLFRVARETDSLALKADAHHLSVDVWTSLGVGVGLSLAYLTHQPILDPIAALLVALFILRTSYQLTRDAFMPLVDTRLPDAEVRAVEAILNNDVLVLSWHKLRTRKSGSERHIDVHIQVDDQMSLRDAHRLTEDLEDGMRHALPNVNVVIHTEPYEEEMRHHAAEQKNGESGGKARQKQK